MFQWRFQYDVSTVQITKIRIYTRYISNNKKSFTKTFIWKIILVLDIGWCGSCSLCRWFFKSSTFGFFIHILHICDSFLRVMFYNWPKHAKQGINTSTYFFSRPDVHFAYSFCLLNINFVLMLLVFKLFFECFLDQLWHFPKLSLLNPTG